MAVTGGAPVPAWNQNGQPAPLMPRRGLGSVVGRAEVPRYSGSSWFSSQSHDLRAQVSGSFKLYVEVSLCRILA